MTLGVTMAFGCTPVPEISRWAAAAERAGAESVWLGEAWRELSVPLSAAALSTERVTLGAGVMQIFPAHPVQTALQAAQLQELSGGRFALGVGLGASFVVERWFGLAYERPLARAREFIEVARGALASRRGDPFSYDGSIFSTRRYRMPFGSELADVPILLAAVGPRMLELAGEVADGVVLGAIHSDGYLEEVRERLSVGADRAGRDPGEIRILAFMLCAASAAREEGRDLARASLAYSAQYPHYRRRLTEEGFGAEASQIADRVRAHDQDGALDLVSDELVDRFSIAGTREECRARAAEVSPLIDELILTLVPFRIDEAQTAGRLLDGLEALASSPAGDIPAAPV